MSTHSTHKMRSSDSSYYDEICENCKEPDWNTHTNPQLEKTCRVVMGMPPELWAFEQGVLKHWSSHGGGKGTTRYIRDDVHEVYVAGPVAAIDKIESLQTTVMDLATDLSKVTMKLQRATRGLEFIACEDNAEGHHAKRVLADIEKIKENDNA